MRQKIFGMIAQPLDRNDKARLLYRARALMRPTQKGAHYGAISAKAYSVLCALLMGFHNSATGRCFPSYDRISEAAGCCRQTVATALAALEAAGLLRVCNRLLRVRWKDEAALAMRVRVVRTSNAYTFPAIGAARPPAEPSESKLCPGTDSKSSNPSLADALERWKEAFRRREAAPSVQN